MTKVKIHLSPTRFPPEILSLETVNLTFSEAVKVSSFVLGASVFNYSWAHIAGILLAESVISIVSEITLGSLATQNRLNKDQANLLHTITKINLIIFASSLMEMYKCAPTKIIVGLSLASLAIEIFKFGLEFRRSIKISTIDFISAN